MSLGNWDSITFVGGSDKHTAGLTSEHEDMAVQLYKNWLYVCCPLTAGKEFEVHSGEIESGCTHIHARRGPQSGIYFLVYDQEHAFAGCGVYGFQGVRWVGVKPASRKFLLAFVDKIIRKYPTGVAVEKMRRGMNP